ncbi:MAG TPA: SDR family NAD(P)-dependent oxidoreductase [Acidimicrobiales bacterium]|jgi:short-subunit dehydrogenase|nr:SDR family NAD(P)-dependent oxidoreductase [Acidimicrobiales bacterium]
MDIAGGVAVVTGASSGIGATVATDLAHRGATVAAVARRKDKLDEVVERCRQYAAASTAVPADISSRRECERVIAEVEARFGRVDILVNNAGISIHKNAARTTADDVERLMAVNFFAPVYLTTAALQGMLERRQGAVINITSVAGYVPNPGEAAYGAAKAALSLWTHGLAVDLHDSGVQLTVVSPGPIDTEIWSLDEELIYTGKLYPPQVVADAVADAVEKGWVHRTVPRRYGLVGAMYPIVGRPMRWGLRRFEAQAKKKLGS